jgi:translation initiation factor 2B subunit (eIF-2B alpha/beta/delta family)
MKMNSNAEQVVKPDHYQGKGGLQAIDVIEAFGLGFSLGNVIKYVLRAGKKEDRLQDLEKAMEYLKFEIENTKRIVKEVEAYIANLPEDL